MQSKCKNILKTARNPVQNSVCINAVEYGSMILYLAMYIYIYISSVSYFWFRRTSVCVSQVWLCLQTDQRISLIIWLCQLDSLNQAYHFFAFCFTNSTAIECVIINCMPVTLSWKWMRWNAKLYAISKWSPFRPPFFLSRFGNRKEKTQTILHVSNIHSWYIRQLSSFLFFFLF